MYSAPSVSYPVGRSRAWRLTLALVWLAGALLTLVWCTQVDGPGWRQWLALACVLAGGALASAGWRASLTGVLHWDGAGWQWHDEACAEPVAGLLAVQLDLQQCLLVRLHCAGGARRWLWLEQRRAPERWGDLRRAVFARAAAREASSPA
jgi:hypothetical protein